MARLNCWLHHFQLAPIPSSQTSGVPFAVSISARGPTDASMTFFRGPLSLHTLTDGLMTPVTPTIVSNAIRGDWNGPVKIDGWGTNVHLIVVGPGGSPQTNSNPFNVASPQWATQARIKELRRDEQGVQVRFDSHTNGAYQLQATTNLSVAPWIPLDSPVMGIGAETYIIDPATLPSERRFYRLEVRPRQ